MCNRVALIWLLAFVTQSCALNALFVSIAGAGHITPVFELAKAMKSHNITFVTLQSAQAYINLNAYRSPSFRIIYANDSPNALQDEKNREQELMVILAGRSLFDAVSSVVPILGEMLLSLLNKTIHVLMSERFDVVVAGGAIVGVPLLCEKIQVPCVVQSPTSFPDIFDFNLPAPVSLLSSSDLTQLKYRLYNAATSIHVMTRLVPKLVPGVYKLFQTRPQVPGPFYDSFALTNILRSKAKALNLVSVPSTFFTPSYTHHYIKHLGALIDDASADHADNALNRWITSKPAHSIVYGAFGSSSLIQYDRMASLIAGLATFLVQTNDSFLLLAFRSMNYDTYLAALTDLADDRLRQVLANEERVRVVNGFVEQKWILQQDSVKMFLSHCGMGSCLEGLYCSKPILCMPFNMEQFTNAIRVDQLGVGRSLFVPPSRLQSLMKPYDFTRYTFTASEVTSKAVLLWMDASYGKAAELMSLEMKHAGGLKRAVEEIEFFVKLNGDLDRFAPFQSTLPFYQRYMLDLLLILIVLPGVVIVYIASKCCKRRRKTKTD